LEQIHDEGSSDFYKIPNLGKTRASEDFGRVVFHTENVDKLYSYMKQDKIYIPQSTLCLKKNLPMLHGGEKGSLIFANQAAINYRLHSQPLSRADQ
jgi:hypothetical protein